MKSYEETVSTVLTRIEHYRAAQKRKRQTVIKTTIPLCCLCVIGALSFALWKNNPSQPDRMADASPSTAVTPTAPTTAQIPESQNKIIIHSIEDDDINRMYINLSLDDFVPMSEDQVNAYYGINVYPSIPEDLSAWGEPAGIFKRDGGTGEIYYDQIRQDYSNEELCRYIMVETAKGKLPFHCFAIPDTSSGNSVINGQDVTIGINEFGQYSVWFLYQGVGFYIGAEGITQQELIDVIASLIPS